MKLSKDVLVSEYPDYATAVALSFEGKGLAQLKDLSLCAAVEYLSARFNAITSTREVTACRHLWVLDLQQNHLRELDGVGQFAALGTLVITGNELQLSALRPLEGLVLIHLEATFAKGTRKEVVRALPGTHRLGTVDLQREIHKSKRAFRLRSSPRLR